MSDDWKAAWQPVIDSIGQDFSDGVVRKGADVIDKSAIRRFLEFLEFDCPLHYDESVAEQYGYPAILAPCSSLFTFTFPPIWEPGKTAFDSAERNTQLDEPMLRGRTGRPVPGPATTGFFGTDIEIEYLRPFGVGDRLTRRGRKLVACQPKETSVGQGAFLTFETEVVDQRDEVVARFRTGVFAYVPHAK